MKDSHKLGTQTLADLYDCDPKQLDDPDVICRLMVEAAQRAGAHIVGHSFHHFSPQGVSGVLILAESHFAIHTWPEHAYAALDLFTCGNTISAEACLPYLIEAFHSARHTCTCITRGAVPADLRAAS
jgi:S-adenosylmethionine decarboxylase proenzyme